MRAWDTQGWLLVDTEVNAAVYGAGGDFMLVYLDQNGKGDEALVMEAIRREYVLCGVLSVMGEHAGAKCLPNPDAVYTMMHAAIAFVQDMPGRLSSASWLTRLLELPDTRKLEG